MTFCVFFDKLLVESRYGESTTGKDNSVILWDVATGEKIKAFYGDLAEVKGIYKMERR